MSVPIYRWKDLSIDFVTGLPILTDWKGDSYDLILVIIDQFTKMVYYKLFKITMNTLGLAKVIIDVVMRYHSLPDSIVTNQKSLFTLKFLLLLYYFFGIKQKFSTTFYPQTDGQSKRQDSTMKAYFQAFVNFEQNDWIQLLLIAEFAYNNAKNTSTGHIFFKLNCRYHLWVSYKKDLDFCSKSKTTKELSSELQNFIAIC